MKDDFSTFEHIRDRGGSPLEAAKLADSRGFKISEVIRMLRAVYGLSLAQGKEAFLIATGQASNLAEHQEWIANLLLPELERAERVAGKSVAVFQSDAFDLEFPNDGADPNYPPKGKDVAEFVAIGLERLGYKTSPPLMDDAHWELDVARGPSQYSLAIHWAPKKQAPPFDYWVIQTQRDHGLLYGLFRKADTATVQTLCEDLDRVLESEVVKGLQWEDLKTFHSWY